MIIDSNTLTVTREVFAFDAEMVNGVASVPYPAIYAGSRIRHFSQADTVKGALRSVITPGIGFSIHSSDGADHGLVYCEVIQK